jgi:hypothetical protein
MHGSNSQEHGADQERNSSKEQQRRCRHPRQSPHHEHRSKHTGQSAWSKLQRRVKRRSTSRVLNELEEVVEPDTKGAPAQSGYDQGPSHLCIVDDGYIEDRLLSSFLDEGEQTQ